MIDNQVVPFLDQGFPRFRRQANGQFRHLWWVQDGAPAHRRIIVRDRLRDLFGNRVIALNHVIEWPPRSPDLTPLDFFLVGLPKGSCVHNSSSKSERPSAEDNQGSEHSQAKQADDSPCCWRNDAPSPTLHSTKWWPCGGLRQCQHCHNCVRHCGYEHVKKELDIVRTRTLRHCKD